MTYLCCSLLRRKFLYSHCVWLQLEDFLPVMKLYDLLYPETEPLPLPNINNASCTFKMAVTSIWIHLSKKAQNERLQRPIPHALSTHIEYDCKHYFMFLLSLLSLDDARSIMFVCHYILMKSNVCLSFVFIIFLLDF